MTDLCRKSVLRDTHKIHQILDVRYLSRDWVMSREKPCSSLTVPKLVTTKIACAGRAGRLLARPKVS